LSVAVIADTHSRPHPRTVEWVAALKPDHILHAGDIGDPGCVEAFAEVAPTTVVRGNIDPTGFPDSVALGIEAAGEPYFRILLTHIAVVGPKLRGDAVTRAKQHGAQMVVCGHSHVPFVGRDRGLMIFNPGSIGPRRFQLPITFGVMTVTHDDLDLFHVDCETGDRWAPSVVAR
jgi:putative phosphoesterase